MTTTARSSVDLAEDWLSGGALPAAEGRGVVKAYPKRSELRRAEARAAGRRGGDRRPAGGRPPGVPVGRPAVASGASVRGGESGRRPVVHPGSVGFVAARLPVAVSPTPAVLPIRQTSTSTRPAGIDLPIVSSVVGVDAFHRPVAPRVPVVPIAVPVSGVSGVGVVPAPPVAPVGLAAPVVASVDPALWGLDLEGVPASGRRRGADAQVVAKRGRSGGVTASLPVRLLGRGKSGAARLLVLALVVGAEGVAVTTMTGHATAVPADPSTSGITGAFALTSPNTADLPAASSLSAASAASPTPTLPGTAAAGTLLTDVGAFEAQQQQSSDAKVTAALAQAKAAAARVKAAADRRARAMRNAQSDPQALAKVMLIDRGWGTSQYTCLVSLWNRESQWNYQASNPSSGAYGIPQALPGSKMASAGSDWRTNPVTQIRWGLDYIADRYGTPCGAWAHSQATGWY